GEGGRGEQGGANLHNWSPYSQVHGCCPNQANAICRGAQTKRRGDVRPVHSPRKWGVRMSQSRRNASSWIAAQRSDSGAAGLLRRGASVSAKGAARHSRIVPSAPAVARRLPSGANATAATCPRWPLSVATSARTGTFQNLTVPSRLPVARVL